MIAAPQLDFLGKTVEEPPDRPAQQLTACCNTVYQIGSTFLHNKDYIVKKLRLLFANVPEVTINKYGSLKHWIKKASQEQYWSQLVTCLTNRHATIPVCPDKWPQSRRSPRNHDAPPPQNQQPFPPTPPRINQTGIPNHTKMPENESQQRLPPPTLPRPSPPLRQRPAPPPPPQADGGQDYIPEQVGRSVYDSLKILGLGLGAPEREIKLAYRRLECLYHPEKWDQRQATTDMTLQETKENFQLLNNAQVYLCANL
jgi:hypothetical protein